MDLGFGLPDTSACAAGRSQDGFPSAPRPWELSYHCVERSTKTVHLQKKDIWLSCPSSTISGSISPLIYRKVAPSSTHGHSPTSAGGTYNPPGLSSETKQVLPSIHVSKPASVANIGTPFMPVNPRAETPGLALALPCTLRAWYFQLTCGYTK